MSPVPLISSPTSLPAQGQINIEPARWWMVVPENPRLSIPMWLLSPVSALVPGIGALPKKEQISSLPQTIHEVLGDRYPIITQAKTPKSEALSIYAAFLGQAEYAAFETIWQGTWTVLLQGDEVGQQFYVNLGATRRVAEMKSVDPAAPVVYVVSLDCREVAAP